MKKQITGILLVLMLCVTFSVNYAKADFGDYGGDYDYGYDDYDYDYDDYDYDYSYSYDDYDYDYGNDYGWYDDDDGWSYSNYDYSTGGYDSWGDSSPSYSSAEYSNTDFVVGLIVFIVIVYLIIRVMKKSSGKTAKPRTKRVTVLPPSAAKYQNKDELAAALSALKAADPGFNEADFLEDAANLYVRLQNAWTAKDLEPVRPALSDNFFTQMNRQLQKNYIDVGHTNVVENISVLSTDIIGCEKDSRNDILTVWINARITDYVINDETDTLVKGSRTAEKFMTYQWVFTRPIGHVTTSGKDVDSKHCPNCGAPIDMNQSAVCAYCGATLKAADYDWILTGIKGVRQMTAGS